MDVDKPKETSDQPSPREQIIQGIIQRGIPLVQIDQVQSELVAFLQNNKSFLTEVVSVILPTVADASNARIFESLIWLQWLMFESEPQSFLENLAEKALDQRAVCGAVWGKNDLAYRCRTCEHDQTCAICVPCFQNGNHKNHDYSIMYTGGGCCDCGDITAWKREGFCSKHKGIENVQLVSEEFPNTLGPVLDALFLFWKEKLLAIEDINKRYHGGDNQFALWKFFANELTSSVVDMLLMFCNCSESLLYFVSKRISFSVELLRLLVEGEFFLDKDVVQKLHELLLKLLGEPIFKYEFAKAFVHYYPRTILEAAKECNDSVLDLYPLLASFSVQIFTVPSLTLRLVKEVNLLGVLLECLGHLFQSCAGEDGCLQADKWSNLHDTTIRVVVDIRFALSHKEVPKYVAQEHPDFIKTWVRLLSHVQGMDPQKRATGLHVEEENENLHTPFILEYYLQLLNNLMIKGAFSVDEVNTIKSDLEGPVDESLTRLSKVGRHSEDSSIFLLGNRSCTSYSASTSSEADSYSGRHSIPSRVPLSIFESLKAIEDWLEPEAAQNANLHAPENSGGTMSNLLNLQKHLFRNRNKSSGIVVNRKRMPWQSLVGLRQAPRRGKSEGTSKSLYDLDINGDIDMKIMDVPAHQMVLDNHLLEIYSDPEVCGILSSVAWPEIAFDVSSEEISFHIPLHRFLSLALQKGMKLYFNETCVSETAGVISVTPSPSHDFFKQILEGFHPYGFSSCIMEHPLRLRVFCAQVHAGMWRRNGNAGISLCDWYRSVRSSNIGIEMDLFLLQCCAALAPPELFVARVLERFALSGYLSLNLAEYNEYEPVLVQEMLTLLIQIVKERRFCGFSTSENLQRELVQKLSIGDATHSQLIKALPHDLSKIEGVQKVVDSLATYTKPSGMKQGVYSLRKEHWKELDLYHPRWNVRDLQVAEERYLRFCKIAPLFVQVPCWTKICSPLNSIGKIATSKMVLQIVRAVLFYAVYTEKRSICRAPDDVLIRALHLLSLSLDICEMHKDCKTEGDPSNLDSLYSEGGFPIVAHATEIISTRINKGPARWVHESLLSLIVLLTKKYKKENDHNPMDPGGPNLSSLAEGLLKRFSRLSADCMREVKKLAPYTFEATQYNSTCDAHKPDSSAGTEDRKAKARKHQAAILEKMRTEQSKFIATLKPVEDDSITLKSGDGQIYEQIAPVCSLCLDANAESPLSVIILLQRSRLSSLTDEGTPSWADIAQYDGQNSALDKMVGDWSTDDLVGSEVASPTESEFDHDLQSPGSDGYLHAVEDGHNRNIRQRCTSMETDSSLLSISEHDLYRCILKDMNELYCNSNSQVVCQQPFSAFAVDGSKNRQKAGLGAVEHNKATLSRDPSRLYSSVSFSEGISHFAGASTSSELPSEDKFGPFDCDGIYISSCGHAVHQECHDRYVSSLRQRGLGFEGRHLVDPSRGEFLCPVCRRFANSILPLFPDEHDAETKQTSFPNSGLIATDVSSITTKLDSNPRLRHAISLLLCSSKMLTHVRISDVSLGKVNDVIEPALEPSICKLHELYFPHLRGNLSKIYKINNSLLLWDTLRYAIISTEIAARGKGDRLSEGLDSVTKILYEELNSSNGVSLSALLRVSQIARGLDHSQLQLRFKSIQLFARAICAGMTGGIGFSDFGTTPCLLEDPENGNAFLHKFFKVASDPILIHDAFSSFMWILFSLPIPFISSEECLLSLVHLFHVVCVIQALITCFGKHHFDASVFGDCVLIDICKNMGKSELVQQFFVSHHIDDSCNIKDMVRKLTFPYLRKCALLWMLLKLPTSIPGSDNHHLMHESGVCSSNQLSDNRDNCLTEFGLTELENMFQICSPYVIYNDKVVHTLALEWCEHFRHYSRICKWKHILYCNPAVPFRLMQLPLLYQDLLQRYNKKQCPNCKVVPEEPALCLFCGRICSPNWKPCCSASRCHIHAKICGAGIGAFLLIRSTAILLQRSSRQSLWPSPYLDAFGEEDIGVSRGKPLYLSQERYSALTNLIASHGLDRSSEVLRRTAITF